LRAAAVGLLALALAMSAGGACSQNRPCRPDTIFVHIDLGPFPSATTEQVDVTLDSTGTTTTTVLGIPSGAKEGGLDVAFPNGYPTGQSVFIQVTLSNFTGVIASRGVVIGSAAAGCDVAEIKFNGGDRLTGEGGQGGVGGEGGAGGSAVGGDGGGGAGAEGGIGGDGGGGATGGSIGGSVGGSFAGRGGVGGTGGVGGRGGTGGTMCIAMNENCFNNKDDDCDGNIDCGDTDCAPVAYCTPLDASGGRLGVVVPAMTSCPSGYTDGGTIVNGMSAGLCTGCSCRPPTVTCSTIVSSFASFNDCTNSAIVGTQETTFNSTQACTTPSWLGSTLGTIYGVQTTMFTPILSGACVASGTATPVPVTWSSTSKFCVPTVGGGCGSGQVCVPATAVPKCTMFDGSPSCPAGTTRSEWYTGAADSRTCGACTCGSANGANCINVTLKVGSDYSCNVTTLNIVSGQRQCTSTGINSPGLIFSGTPIQPTCAANAETFGAVGPTGPKTICCM